MCGRMILSEPDWDAIARLLGAGADAADAAAWAPRYNVAPSQRHPIVTARGGRRTLRPADWGLPGRERLVINARAETLAEKVMFAGALAERRCVVPVDGWYEWRDGQPYRLHAPDGSVLALAGLWEPGPNGPRFVVVTTAANELCADIHHRMPALLAPSCIGDWLARPARELLQPAPAGRLVATPVSTRVDSAAHDDASLLTAVRAQRQLSLF